MTVIPLELEQVDAGTEHKNIIVGKIRNHVSKPVLLTGKMKEIKLGLTVCLLHSDSIRTQRHS